MRASALQPTAPMEADVSRVNWQHLGAQGPWRWTPKHRAEHATRACAGPAVPKLWAAQACPLAGRLAARTKGPRAHARLSHPDSCPLLSPWVPPFKTRPLAGPVDSPSAHCHSRPPQPSHLRDMSQQAVCCSLSHGSPNVANWRQPAQQEMAQVTVDPSRGTTGNGCPDTQGEGRNTG